MADALSLPVNERTGPIRAAEVLGAAVEMRAEWSPEGWEEFFVYDSAGVTATAWRRIEEASGVYEYRSVGTMPFAAEVFEKMQYTNAYRLQWDAYCKTLELISSEDGLEVCYWDVAYPTPLTNRDYVFYRRLAKLDDGAFMYVGRQCGAGDDHGHPPATGWMAKNMRVDLYYSQQLVEATGADSCKFTLQYRDDPGGSIPKSIVNWAVKTGFPQVYKLIRIHLCV